MAKSLPPIARGEASPRVASAFDRVLSVQRPAVLAHIRSIRSRHPEATPADVIRVLESRYLAAVTGGGAAVGASAAIPAVGTATSIALSGVETVGFLEASALFAQSVSEVHGVAIADPVRARTLVMAMMLGNGGTDLVTQFATQAAGGGVARSRFWGDVITGALPAGVGQQLADRVRNEFLKRFAARQGASVVGRAIPFGIGAVIGGAGNHLLGRKVVQASRTAFGPPPAGFPDELAIVVKRSRVRGRASVEGDGGTRARRLRLPVPRGAHRPPEGLPQIWATTEDEAGAVDRSADSATDRSSTGSSGAS